MVAKVFKFFLLCTALCLLSSFLTGCATTPSVSAILKETVMIHGKKYIPVELFSQAYNLELHWDTFAKKLTLKKDGKEVKMMVGSAVVLLNDTVYSLDKEVRFYRGQVVIPQSFARNKLSFFFREEPVTKRPISVKVRTLPIKSVIIDPGHGGKDPGAIGRRGLKEKDVVLDIAKRLKKKLNVLGIDVILTREDDRFISLYQRSNIANTNAKEIDFFISIHANASRSRWVSGVEVFYLSEFIDDDSRSLKAAKNYDLDLKEDFSGKYTPVILWDLIFRNNRKNSIELSRQISHALSKDLSQKNRGEKPARFYVLKGTNIPAILVEAGFISNPREEKKLRNGFYRDKIAQAIAEGIMQYNSNFAQKRTVRY
jgi:N-acetylmuramoyl-L-alanine amidase